MTRRARSGVVLTLCAGLACAPRGAIVRDQKALAHETHGSDDDAQLVLLSEGLWLTRDLSDDDRKLLAHATDGTHSSSACMSALAAILLHEGAAATKRLEQGVGKPSTPAWAYGRVLAVEWGRATNLTLRQACEGLLALKREDVAERVSRVTEDYAATDDADQFIEWLRDLYPIAVAREVRLAGKSAGAEHPGLEGTYARLLLEVAPLEDNEAVGRLVERMAGSQSEDDVASRVLRMYGESGRSAVRSALIEWARDTKRPARGTRLFQFAHTTSPAWTDAELREIRGAIDVSVGSQDRALQAAATAVSEFVRHSAAAAGRDRRR